MVHICNPDWHYEGEAERQKFKLLISYSEFDANHIRLHEIYPPKPSIDYTLEKKYILFKNGKNHVFLMCVSACMYVYASRVPGGHGSRREHWILL